MESKFEGARLRLDILGLSVLWRRGLDVARPTYRSFLGP